MTIIKHMIISFQTSLFEDGTHSQQNTHSEKRIKKPTEISKRLAVGV
jgi:hypothetical protein